MDARFLDFWEGRYGRFLSGGTSAREARRLAARCFAARKRYFALLREADRAERAGAPPPVASALRHEAACAWGSLDASRIALAGLLGGPGGARLTLGAAGGTPVYLAPFARGHGHRDTAFAPGLQGRSPPEDVVRDAVAAELPALAERLAHGGARGEGNELDRKAAQDVW